jgi:integrase
LRYGRAFTAEETERLLTHAKAARRSPAIYPAILLALDAGLRDAEIRTLQWSRFDLSAAMLTVGASKADAGTGRTIPLHTELAAALMDYTKWYTKRFGTAQPDWYVFPFGKPFPNDPKRPAASFKTGHGRRFGPRRTSRVVFTTAATRSSPRITESGEAGDETIRDLAGHVSRQMLKHYSHIGTEAKRRAVQALVAKQLATAKDQPGTATSTSDAAQISESIGKESPKVAQIH